MTNKHKDPFSSALEEKADVVIRDDAARGRGLPVTEILAWRQWFDERRGRLMSSGGRPTNPDWTMKRQVSFSQEVWKFLEERATECSETGSKVAPGQVASFLLEDAVQTRARTHATQHQETIDLDAELEAISDDRRFREWTMPPPFAGALDNP